MENAAKLMEKNVTHPRRVVNWLQGCARVPLVFAEAEFGGVLHTEPRPLLELVLVVRGTFMLDVGTRHEPLQAGDVAWINAHHGNHADLADNDAVYACLSLDVSGEPALRAWGRRPLLRIFRGPSPTWSREAFREVVRWHRAPDSELRTAMLRAGLIRIIGHLADREPDDFGASLEARLARALALLDARSDDPELTIEDVAREAGVSLSTLRRIFAEGLGVTPMAYLQTLRLNRARDLLAKTTLGVKEVAARVGYADALYFSKAFRRAHGRTPSEVRQAAAPRSLK